MIIVDYFMGWQLRHSVNNSYRLRVGWIGLLVAAV